MQLPSWPKPLLRQALALCGLERYEEAVAVLDKGIRMYSAAAVAAGTAEEKTTASDPSTLDREDLEAFQEAREVAQQAGEAGGVTTGRGVSLDRVRHQTAWILYIRHVPSVES